jgi:hypothetical protein
LQPRSFLQCYSRCRTNGTKRSFRGATAAFEMFSSIPQELLLPSCACG